MMLFKFVATAIVATGLAFTGFDSDNQAIEQSASDCCQADGSSECCVLELPCCAEQSACCADSESLSETVLVAARACCDPDGLAECCVLELACCDDQDCCETGEACCGLGLACCDK